MFEVSDGINFRILQKVTRLLRYFQHDYAHSMTVKNRYFLRFKIKRFDFLKTRNADSILLGFSGFIIGSFQFGSSPFWVRSQRDVETLTKSDTTRLRCFGTEH